MIGRERRRWSVGDESSEVEMPYHCVSCGEDFEPDVICPMCGSNRCRNRTVVAGGGAQGTTSGHPSIGYGLAIFAGGIVFSLYIMMIVNGL